MSEKHFKDENARLGGVIIPRDGPIQKPLAKQKVDSDTEMADESDIQTQGEPDESHEPQEEVNKPTGDTEKPDLDPSSLLKKESDLPENLKQAAQQADLIMFVGQQTCASDLRKKDSSVGMRFRTFAPLLPQRRATLTGHCGLIANGLVTSQDPSLSDDSLLVSVAGLPAEDANRVGCDVRFWHIPSEPLTAQRKFFNPFDDYQFGQNN